MYPPARPHSRPSPGSGTFVTVRTYTDVSCHLKSMADTRVGSWCCAFCGFGRMSDDVCSQRVASLPRAGRWGTWGPGFSRMSDSLTLQNWRHPKLSELAHARPRPVPGLTHAFPLSPEVADESGDQRRPAALHLYHLEVSWGSRRRGLLEGGTLAQTAGASTPWGKGADRPTGSHSPEAHTGGVPPCAAGYWGGMAPQGLRPRGAWRGRDSAAQAVATAPRRGARLPRRYALIVTP